MAGRGRGGPSLSFNLPSGMADRQSMPKVTLEPPPLYPPLQQRIMPLLSSEVDEYLLALSQEFRGSIRSSSFFIKPKIVKKDIVRYTDRYKQAQTETTDEWKPHWDFFPTELKPARKTLKANRVIKPNVKTSKKTAVTSSVDEDIVKKIELREEVEKEKNGDEETQQQEEEVEIEEEFEDDNDYNFDYYDDGGDKYGDDNDGDEGPVY